ncbi:MAG: RimK family alpha-L-glutamate ligase [Myxococcaceae bacterium]|nr:RimK family alpha-L-glutamate ligase [Myxococcaceae bacterium]MBR2979701.1 RimK family alpha-L-glutamate ligase [Myxococcaceae bacterium]
MHLTIFSKSARFYTVRRLAESARMRGHKVRVIDPLQCELVLGDGGTRLFHKGKPLPKTSICLPRLVPSNLRHGLAIAEQLEGQGVPLLNSSQAIARSRDKWRALQWLAAGGVPVPTTILATSAESVSRMVERAGGCPVILRVLRSGEREGVMVCETEQSMNAALEALFGLGHGVMVQQYVREERGRDVRAFLVGGRLIASARRLPETGRIKRSLGHGARFEKCALSPQVRQLAEKAVRLIGLDVATVDLLETPSGVRVLEVNSAPSLQGIEGAVRQDLSAEIILWAEARLRGEGRRRGGA